MRLMPMADNARVDQAIKRWQEELLDLTRRNRLLYFKPSSGALALTHPDVENLFDSLANKSRGFQFYRLPERDEEAIPAADEQLHLLLTDDAQESAPPAIADGNPVEPIVAARPPGPHEVVASGDPKKVEAILYKLYLRSRAALQEQGVNILFVAFGLLDWTEKENGPRVLSPLLLVPVKFERETALAPFTLQPLDEDVIVNPALARKLQIDFQLQLELPEQEADVTLSALLGYLRRLLSARGDWRIRSEAYVGLFSFAKYAMYADLDLNRGRLAQHPVVRAIAGEEDGLRESIASLPSAEFLDERQHPTDTFQVLDADASQQEAIAAVKAGTDLVIQGPPGTGKSQTITNIISECLAAGKTVLFVSEKITALRVVAKRLAEAGLAEFCLEAHSQDVNKALIIKELARVLDDQPELSSANTTIDLERVLLLRKQLNAYVRALHDEANPLQLAAYRIHGEYARLADMPIVLFDLADAGALTQQRLAMLDEAIGRLMRVGEVLLDAKHHPWQGTLFTAFTPQLRAELDHRLARLDAQATALDQTQEALRAAWRLPETRSLESAARLGELLTILDERVVVPDHWFRSPSLVPVFHTAEGHRLWAEDYHSRRSALLTQYNEGVFALDLEPLALALENGGLPEAARIRGQGEPADRAIAARSALGATIRRASTELDAVMAVAAKLGGRLGVGTPLTLAHTGWVQQLTALVLVDPHPRPQWFDLHHRLNLEELVGATIAQQQAANDGRTYLQTKFTDEIYEVANDELLRQFEEDYDSWLRALKPNYRRGMRRLRRLCRDDASLDYAGALEALRQARRVRTAEVWESERRGVLVEGLGRHYVGQRTDWAAVDYALATVKQIGSLFNSQAPPTPLVAILLGQAGGPAVLRPESAELDRALAAFRVVWADLGASLSLVPAPLSQPDIDHVPATELRDWLGTMLRCLEPLWSAHDAISSARTGDACSVAKLAADVREALAIWSMEQELLAASGELRATFGQLFHGLATDWDQILAALQWTGRLLGHFGGSPPEAFLGLLVAGGPGGLPQQAHFPALLWEIWQLVEVLRPSFDPAAYRIGSDDVSRAPLLAVADWARGRHTNLWRLEEWIDYARTLAEVRSTGLGPFVEELARLRPPRELWQGILLRAVYTSWLTWRYTAEPALAQFRSAVHEEIIAQFQRLDRQHWQGTSQRIAARLISRRPQVPLNASPRSEPGFLRREAAKRRRFRPLRKIFASLPNLLPALKPCMLMSPLSVAQFLGESALEFDVVIFDEASQILPADAMGAIGRARQAVIVGDQKQLPPTQFFGASLASNEESDEDDELPESVLDACLGSGLPQKSLMWHYRSRHEGLIAFSNRHFYDSRLITFPSPDASTRAVEFVHVTDGVYDRGSSKVNRAEAARVVDLVVGQVRKNPHQSLGVIAFSEAQAYAITQEVDRHKRLDPSLEVLLNEEDRQDGFFVKNLESVQGDQRDVVFFSIGYGPDQAGNFTMNFGPLNRQGGERRLNVAITRARDHVYVLASFRPHEIDRSRTSATGVHLLRNYLEYAEQGPRALLGEITAEGGDFESPFEESVANALTAHGLRVVTQVGVSGFRIDLAIRDENSDRYILGIECDGKTYHSSKTARDRDRLRQQVLEQLGWRIHRIWSTDWIKDPKREIERTLVVLAQARADWQRARSMPQPLPSRPNIAPTLTAAASAALERPTDVVPSAASIQRVTPDTANRHIASYVVATLPIQGSLDTFRGASSATVAGLVEQVATLEGPVHEDRVIRGVAKCFGIGRAGAQVRSDILTAMRYAAANGRVSRRGKFLWPRGMVEAPLRESGPRSIQEIAPEELAACLLGQVQAAFALSRSDLVTAVAREFGFDRTGSHVSAGITGVVDQLVADGTLLDVGGQIRRQG